MPGAASSSLAERAARLSVAATVVVVLVKGGGGYLSGSVSVLAEALQSVVDVAMSLLALAAVRIAAKPPDRDHPYGHGKAELLSTAVQMVFVIGSAAYIFFEAWRRWQDPQPIAWEIGMAAMGYAIASNQVVAWRLRRVAAQSGSAALRGEAAHLQSDSITSAGVLVGVFLVGVTGVLRIDPVVAALTALIAVGLAMRQLARIAHPLMDGALPAQEIDAIERVLSTHPAVRGYHDLRTRTVGAQRRVELHVMLDDELTFVEAHDQAESIESEISHALGGAHVSIHYEPYEAELLHRQEHH